MSSNNMNLLKNEIQVPNLACRICDKVFVDAQALVRHFQACHMVDNKIVHGVMNPIPYTNFASAQHSSVEQNPKSNTTQFVVSAPSQVPSFHPTRNINPKIFPYLPSSSHEIPSPALPEPKPTLSLPLVHTPIMGGHGFWPSLTLSPPPLPPPPPLPFIMRSLAFGLPTSYGQEAYRVLDMRRSSDCTKLLINQLDKPIREVMEAERSNNDNDGNRFDSNKLDLTLKL
ncbi:Formin-like protein [Actinidia chinensis var. chinensis]|uniref:Formin-like protein n=1 Tax=Actinidia chinensis var. chinensis TaxID=1590841 RepID=A0A2R6PKK6_ACTCC|nr:Formin-like protein [Actinidia chinensis var. chinensis]